MSVNYDTGDVGVIVDAVRNGVALSRWQGGPSKNPTTVEVRAGKLVEYKSRVNFQRMHLQVAGVLDSFHKRDGGEADALKCRSPASINLRVAKKVSKVHRKHDTSEGERGRLRMRRKEGKRLERRRAHFIEPSFTMLGGA